MEMDTENFKYFCTVCNDYFPHESLSIHNETERHVLVETFYSNRKLFNVINTDHPIRVTPDDFNFEDIAIKVNLNQEKTVKFNICNISNSSVTLLDIFGLTNEKHVQIVNIKKPTKPVVILKGGKLNNSFNAGVIINDYGFFEVPIAFTYSSSTDKSEPKISNFVLILDFEVETDWSVTLRPKRPYHMELKKSFLPVIKKIPGPEIKLVGNMMTIYLKMYKPPVEMVAILENKMKESKNLGIKALTLLHAMNKVLGHKENVIDFTRENYVDRFTYLLYMEEAEELIELEQFRKEKVYLKSVKENNISYFRLEVGDGLIEGRPSLIVGDKALIYPLRGKDYGLKNVWYSGLICKVELKSILLRFRKSFHQLFQPDVMKVNVKFEPQRLPYKMCYRALEFVKEREMQFLLFPLENFPFVKSPNFVDKLEFHNEDINNNPEQAQAVLNIVNCTSRPYPYLLFGPPGTGKTVTLVEAIIQNWKLEPENRRKQLVCASSNAAADIITERLLTKSEIPATDIFRMYSPSVKNSQISNVIMSCENAHNLNFNEMNNNYDVIFPSYEEVMGRNIVITTIITAGRLVDGIPCTHFSHVLIDESGHCMEPECLVPFMGLITGENKRVHGQLVLAGDPLQLGPVLRSPAKDYGLQKSLLERLMTSDSMYKKNPETEKYNELVLTKLHLNFRSHPAIIEIPNKLFYDRELKAAGKKEITETFCNWNELPTKQFPIIFHGIIGKEDREETSPSFFNLNEVNLIMHYIKECLVGKTINGRLIKTTDIGVVSPYKKQIQKLSIALKTKGLNGITLGSVEQFQGNEKLIIIVSTVRSMPKDEQTSLGFLKNPKRFNVAVTRAQALLIIIGNPIVLAEDENWGEMLKYCYDNGGYTGIPVEYLKNKIDIKLTNNVKSLVSSTSLLSLSSRTIDGDELIDDYTIDVLSCASSSSHTDTLEEYSNDIEITNNDSECLEEEQEETEEEEEEEVTGAYACKNSDKKLKIGRKSKCGTKNGEITTDEFNYNDTVKIMLDSKTNEIDHRCNLLKYNTLANNSEITLNVTEGNNKHNDKIMINDLKNENKVCISEKITHSNNTKTSLNDSESGKTGVKKKNMQNDVKLHHSLEDFACNFRKYSDESKQGVIYLEKPIISSTVNEEKFSASNVYDNVLNNEVRIPTSTNRSIYSSSTSAHSNSHDYSILSTSLKKICEISREIRKGETEKEGKHIGFLCLFKIPMTKDSTTDCEICAVNHFLNGRDAKATEIH